VIRARSAVVHADAAAALALSQNFVCSMLKSHGTARRLILAAYAPARSQAEWEAPLLLIAL
jgi:hypothetical protein